MDIQKPFVEAGIEVLDLLHDQSGRLLESQQWSLRETLKGLLKNISPHDFVEKTRNLTKSTPDGEARNPESCYARIPLLAPVMRRLREVIPPGGPGLAKQIGHDDIKLLRGRIEGLVQLLGNEPFHEPEADDEESESRPLSERDIRKLVAEIRIRRTNTQTPRARHNKGAGPRTR